MTSFPLPIPGLGKSLTIVQFPFTVSNTVIVALAVDEWAVSFGTARRGLGGLRSRPVPYSMYQI